MKLKNIYLLTITTSLGVGLQPVKGNTKLQAKKRYKKRFPKSKIIACRQADGDINKTILMGAI